MQASLFLNRGESCHNLRIIPIYSDCIKTLLSSSWPSRAQKSTSASSLRLSSPACSYTNLSRDGAESTISPDRQLIGLFLGSPILSVPQYGAPALASRAGLPRAGAMPSCGVPQRLYIYIKRHDKTMDLRSLSFSFPTSIYHHLHSRNFHYQPLPDDGQKFFPARDMFRVVKLRDNHVTSRGAGKGF
jgi:hypothetical protein